VELTSSFEVDRPADTAARIAAGEETLTRLFEGGRTEIVERDGNCCTVRTHYTALGREGVATFQFLYCDDGTIQFEKVCDGNVWRRLEGIVSFAAVKSGRRKGGTRVTLHLAGNTKRLVPELAIRAPMKEQLEQMTAALKKRLEQSDGD